MLVLKGYGNNYRETLPYDVALGGDLEGDERVDAALRQDCSRAQGLKLLSVSEMTCVIQHLR